MFFFLKRTLAQISLMFINLRTKVIELKIERPKLEFPNRLEINRVSLMNLVSLNSV